MINAQTSAGESRLEVLLAREGLDALICRLPENIVYLTGTYPVHGASLACRWPGMTPRLLQPECERDWVREGRAYVQFFPWGHLGEPALETSFAEFLRQLAAGQDWDGRRIGVEMDPSTTAPAYRSAENLLPDTAFRSLVSKAFPASRLVDCCALLEEARTIKSADDLAGIRRACRIADLGLQALKKDLAEGMDEVSAAALVEQTIRTSGTGFESARLVRAFAEVTSGPEGSFRQSMLIPAGRRRIEAGDLVIIELAVCADGYWSDLTRVYCAGKPNEEQRRVYNAVRAAQLAAAQELQAGHPFSAPDDAARRTLVQADLGRYFKHGTGHGLGWRYHETSPQLAPARQELLQVGMVTSVEPGVYIPGVGGIRIEDNLAVTTNGPVWLSDPVPPW